MPFTKFFKYVILIIIACIITLWITAQLLAPYVRNEAVYVAASIDKEERLNTLPKPRLIFVGGSGMALGLNSRLVKEKTGWRVINMGIHAGLGLPFMLNESLDGLKADDVVILCPEYSLDKGDIKLQTQLVDLNPRAKKYITFSYMDHIRFYIQNVQRCLSSAFYKVTGTDQLDHLYNRSAFTKEGDVIAHYKLPARRLLDDMVKWHRLDGDLFVKEINNFSNRARSKGATVYLSYPPLCKSAFALNYKTITDLERKYKTELVCSIVGKPTDFVFDDHYFYDTVYHLNESGVQKRTARMIQLLSPHIR